MLVGTDVWARVVFVWEETGVPGGNPPVWLGDHMTISHVDAGYRTRVASVRGECVNTTPAKLVVIWYIWSILKSHNFSTVQLPKDMNSMKQYKSSTMV